jgi:hypothetical protein
MPTTPPCPLPAACSVLFTCKVIPSTSTSGPSVTGFSGCYLEDGTLVDDSVTCTSSFPESNPCSQATLSSGAITGRTGIWPGNEVWCDISPNVEEYNPETGEFDLVGGPATDACCYQKGLCMDIPSANGFALSGGLTDINNIDLRMDSTGKLNVFYQDMYGHAENLTGIFE